MFNEISVLKDSCSQSYSIMTTMKITDYLDLIEGCQQLNAQRDVLRTRAATTIRKRLIEDITKGAIIPPLVLGIVVISGITKEDEVSNMVYEVIEDIDVIDQLEIEDKKIEDMK